jgi:hypothetical protein
MAGRLAGIETFEIRRPDPVILGTLTRPRPASCLSRWGPSAAMLISTATPPTRPCSNTLHQATVCGRRPGRKAAMGRALRSANGPRARPRRGWSTSSEGARSVGYLPATAAFGPFRKTKRPPGCPVHRSERRAPARLWITIFPNYRAWPSGYILIVRDRYRGDSQMDVQRSVIEQARYRLSACRLLMRAPALPDT